jgi:hypothetical protein
MAGKDAGCTRKVIDRNLEAAREYLKEVKEGMKRHPNPSPTQDTLERAERRIADLTEKSAVADTLHYKVGKVLASSGRRVGPGPDSPLLDWALIELEGPSDPSRHIRHQLKSCP